MGRHRIPEGERKITVTINLKRKIVDKIREEVGEPKQVIEKMILDRFGGEESPKG
ncbi:hypothetical protein [Paenibacillus sp. MMO-177]|uniref:hypothetical protein n=1 Tax=Paenibacillus sp. MMO-177 TaxID=3081289 RepID=UPI00301A435A